MGANARLFWVLSVFFALLAVVYTVWTLLYGAQDLAQDPGAAGQPGPRVEWIGTLGLALCAVAAGLIAFYVSRIHRSQGGELAEDRVDAEIDDGDAEQGFFSPWSWWPILLAASAALLFTGIAVGVWIAIIGVVVGVISLVGWAFEYHRGRFGH